MWPNLKETADLVTFTEEILDRKLHFLYSVTTEELINVTRLRNIDMAMKILSFNN